MITSRPAVSFDDVVRRICAEYMEMPGLSVTHEQAQRLWGLDATTCLEVLECLVERAFLYRPHSNQYARLTEGPTRAGFRMAKADIRRTVVRERKL